jgi:hypothetical protein
MEKIMTLTCICLMVIATAAAGENLGVSPFAEGAIDGEFQIAQYRKPDIAGPSKLLVYTGNKTITQGRCCYEVVGWFTSQGFVLPSDARVRVIGAAFSRNGIFPATIRVDIESDENGRPSGTVLASSKEKQVDLRGYRWPEYAIVLLMIDANLQGGVPYHLVFHATEGAFFIDGTNQREYGYEDGTMCQTLDGGITWNCVKNEDLYFGMGGFWR